MSTSLGSERFEPGGYRKVARRRWLIVPGLAVLGLAAAAAYVAVVPQAYAATAVVVLPTQAEPSEGIVLIPGLVPDVHGQAQAVRSIGVAAIAGRLMHSGLSARALSEEVTVTVPPDSWRLDIACAGPSASRAATCANAFAGAYLRSRSHSAASLVDAQVKWLQRKVNSLYRARARLNTKIAALPPDSPRRVTDQAQLKSDHGQLRFLARQIVAALGELPNGTSGSILSLATPPAASSGPSTLLVLPAGLATGLLLGLIAVFLVSRYAAVGPRVRH